MTLEEIQTLIKGFSIIAFSGVISSAFYIGNFKIENSDFMKIHKDYKKSVENNSTTYKNEIQKYNKEAFEYCKKLEKMSLDDLELFIKMFKDLWEKTDGYNANATSIAGYERVYLSIKNNGCCRHFADDLVAKLNFINPNYNARLIVVYLKNSDFKCYTIPIKRKFLEVKESSIPTKKEKTEKTFNHAVCAVDIPGKNITLMLDPTNNIIGYFKGKKIILFEAKATGYTYTNKSNYMLSINPQKIIKHEIKTNFNKLKSDKKINELYGKQAQEKAYKNILYIDGDSNIGYSKTI